MPDLVRNYLIIGALEHKAYLLRLLAPVGFREKAGLTPLGRPTPEAVAEAVAFLAAAQFTTGCIIAVDGGEEAVAV